MKVAVFILILLAAASVYCQEMDNVIREDVGEYVATVTAEGTVTSIDADGGIITIRPFDAVDLNNDQLTIQILPEAEVYKNGDKIISSDIQISDVVTVEYYDDPSGLRATTVTVQ